MPIVNNTNLLGKKILEILDNATKDWPVNPSNVAEGYKALLGSKNPAGLYMDALKGISSNLGKDTQNYLDRINGGDPEAAINLMLMTGNLKNPMSPQAIADRVHERMLMNRAANRPVLEGIDPAHLDIVEGLARQGKQVPQSSFSDFVKGVASKGKFEAPEASYGGPQSLMERDYGTLNDKDRNVVNNLLDPSFIKSLLPFLFAGGAAASKGGE